MSTEALNLDTACEHPDFLARVEVCRVIREGQPETSETSADAYTVSVRVHCAACDEPFRFIVASSDEHVLTLAALEGGTEDAR